MSPPGADKWHLCRLKHNSLVLQQDTAITPARYLTLGTVLGLVRLSVHVNQVTASYARVSLSTQRGEYSAASFLPVPGECLLIGEHTPLSAGVLQRSAR